MEAREEIKRLEEQATYHKRAVRSHRAKLRECMNRLAALRRWCDENGFGFTIEREGETHGEEIPPVTGD